MKIMHAGWIILLLLDRGTPAPPEGQQICPMLKIGRQFMVIGSSYIIIGNCHPAPDQILFTSIPLMRGIIPEGNMKAVNKGSMAGVFPAANMAAKLD